MNTDVVKINRTASEDKQLLDVMTNLVVLGMVGFNDNGPISYNFFKNRASVHKYSGSRTRKIVYVGVPKRNLFAFYTSNGSDAECLKEAYEYYTQLVKGDVSPFLEKDVQWTSGGILMIYRETI
jgi:hypothetical protein